MVGLCHGAEAYGRDVMVVESLRTVAELVLLNKSEAQELKDNVGKLSAQVEELSSKLKGHREKLTQVEELASKLKAEREDLAQAEELTPKPEAGREKLAVRQILYVVNDKVLRKVMQQINMSPDEFWRKFPLCNFGAIERHPELMSAWPHVVESLGLDSATTPKGLWGELKFGIKGLDNDIHADDFDKLSYDELRARTDSIFSGKLERCKKTFLHFLDLSVKLGGDLYE